MHEPKKWAESEAHGPWIQTRSGRKFYLTDPARSEVHVDDVAYSLARLNRWTGHCHTYSVAEHSVRVMRDVIARGYAPLAMQALLHDAHEYIVGDVSSPLKSLCPDLKKIERECAIAVRTALRVDVDLHQEVIVSDLRLLGAERRDLFAFTIPWDWEPPSSEGIGHIVPWDERTARIAFLDCYDRLVSGKLP